MQLVEWQEVGMNSSSKRIGQYGGSEQKLLFVLQDMMETMMSCKLSRCIYIRKLNRVVTCWDVIIRSVN